LTVIAQGSAVLIAPGRFVTNCHVLEGGKHFVISRREDKVIERALLVNYERGRDLCELDLAQPKPGFDKPVEIAPADSLHIGDAVFAIGSPGIARAQTDQRAPRALSEHDDNKLPSRIYEQMAKKGELSGLADEWPSAKCTSR
jgi:hypothetical protein